MIKIYALDISCLKDESLYKKSLSLLPSHRLSALERITDEQTRLAFIGAGLLLRYGFLQRGLLVDNFTFAKTPNGKPYAKGDIAPHFNISHSGCMAVCAFSDYEVGVDVQLVKPVLPKLLDYVCAEHESAWVYSLPPDVRDEAFCRIWSAKESLVKLMGGSVLNLRHISLLFESDTLSVPGYNARFFEYSLSGYRLSACSEHDNTCEIIYPEDVFNA